MEAATPPLANARYTTEKFCSLFSILCAPDFLLKGKNFSVVFCSERAGGGCGHCFICSRTKNGGGEGEEIFCPLAEEKKCGH